MKNYTLEELLATQKARKIIDENLSSYNDEDYVYAVLEYAYWSRINEKTIYDFEDLENAIHDIEYNKYTIYNDIDSYHDSCDDLIDFNNSNEILQRYFDYEAYHNDCDYDITECSNWVVIWNY